MGAVVRTPPLKIYQLEGIIKIFSRMKISLSFFLIILLYYINSVQLQHSGDLTLLV